MNEIEQLLSWKEGQKNTVPLMKGITKGGMAKIRLKIDVTPLGYAAFLIAVVILVFGMGMAGVPSMVILMMSSFFMILGAFFVVTIPKRGDYGQTMFEIMLDTFNKTRFQKRLQV